MSRLALPALLALAGLAGGIAAGLAVRPDPVEPAAAEAPAGTRDYVRLTNQFIVPLVEEGRVAAMVILTLGLEVEAGASETVFAREPKLRDAFLQVLFAHANTGGFQGRFTETASLAALRQALREAAATVLGPLSHDVLIADLVRQDS